MTNMLKTQGKFCSNQLIENQSPAWFCIDLAAPSIVALTPPGGLAASDLLPLSPTPFMILGSPEGGQ